MKSRIFLSCVSGCLLVLCSPGFPLPWLAWIALIPLLAALRFAGLGVSFSLGLLSGFVFFPGSFYWINHVSGITWYDYLVLGIYLAVYIGFFGAGLSFLTDKLQLPMLLVTPMLWVALEYVRSEAGFLALPMAKLGHSQYLNTSLIQIADLTGDYGVSFIVALINTALFTLLARGENLRHALLMLPLGIGIPITYGYGVSFAQKNDQTLPVAVVQGNIPPEERQRPEAVIQYFEKYARLSREVANHENPSLIVWPEGAVPNYLIKDLRGINRIALIAAETHAYLIIGSSDRAKFGTDISAKTIKPLNTAYLISRTGKIIDSYHKIRLVPFSEYLPMADIIPWSARLRASAGNYYSGKNFSLFNIDAKKVGVLICWEGLFPDMAREFVKQGADILINIGNEAWFGKTTAPYQMLAAVVFRAVENRVAIARSINTGVSGFIDPSGKILATVNQDGQELFVAGYSGRDLPALKRGKLTLYTTYGDLFIYLNLALLFAMILYRMLRPSSNKMIECLNEIK